MPRRCPHDPRHECPLYLASHMGGGFGCDDGTAWDGRCAVDNGADYGAMAARFAAHHPREFSENELYIAGNRAREQRARNMRLNGIH